MNSVLIVEDDRSLVDDLSYFLSFNGYKVRSISLPSEALDALSGRIKEDFLILDIMMRKPAAMNLKSPECETGEAFYEIFRENNELVPVVIISAKDKDDIGIDFGGAPVRYIKKPYSLRADNVVKALKELGDEAG